MPDGPASSRSSVVAPGTRAGTGLRAVLVGPDPDVVLLEPEPDAVLQLERRDVLLGQLQPSGPVEHRELLADRAVVAVVAQLGPAERLGRGPAVADRDRPLDLLRHDR